MILFLDFDGVLHPIPCKNADLLCHIPRLEKVLRDYPQVQIVISSLWRCEQPIEQLRGWFSEDIRPRVIGITPFISECDERTGFIIAQTRHAEILEWIEQNKYSGPWVALDDAVNQFPEGCGQLIACQTETGFDVHAAAELRAYVRFYTDSA
jgi:hypothetical protein